jgi:xanthine dehydrogenase accessory factor
VRWLLDTHVPYIGVLGPRARIDNLLRQVGAEGNDRVFGPIGLDLGTDGPEQIALSIVAEVLAVLSGRSPVHLRETEGVIHGD